MKDTNEFDPNLPTDRQPLTEWDIPLDEADSYVDWDVISDSYVDCDEISDSYVDWDEVSDADADWRWETGDEYIIEAQDFYDDEQAFGSAGFGMDETYNY